MKGHQGCIDFLSTFRTPKIRSYKTTAQSVGPWLSNMSDEEDNVLRSRASSAKSNNSNSSSRPQSSVSAKSSRPVSAKSSRPASSKSTASSVLGWGDVEDKDPEKAAPENEEQKEEENDGDEEELIQEEDPPKVCLIRILLGLI